jgi:D-hexose-6-phosphate mutarotase
LVDPQSQDRRTEGGAAAVPDRSDRCATTQSGIFKAEDTRWDRKACVEAKQVAVVRHPSDGESFKSSKTALEGLVSIVVRKGYFRLLVASI